ncbi:MAG: endonuclease/exonuclease/phosphatase family protein [Candidatus Krumholzibacteria bacterium]|nr:endonuclease/exonuclease/phosphatase family protein [Candidatus Krumholzibacteria bacterium]
MPENLRSVPEIVLLLAAAALIPVSIICPMAESRSGVVSVLNQHNETKPQVPLVTIMQIQGTAHVSPLSGARVATEGIVTVVTPNGFFMQDRTGDGSDRTSDGIFVFTESRLAVDIGDEVLVEGEVFEFLPGGDVENLTITEIIARAVVVSTSGLRLPEPTVIGTAGRVPPDEVIDNDGLTVFDPLEDGIDFCESLEGMRVRIRDPLAVATRNRFGEFWVVSDRGMVATGINRRDGITVRERDFNPERIQVDDTLMPGSSPLLQIGDRLDDITGVLSYSFGNYEVLPVTTPSVAASGLRLETTPLSARDHRLTVASFNVSNLDASQQLRINRLATIIVFNLHVPDILGLQEVMDNSGRQDDGTVDASDTYGALIAAIAAVGGPTYDFRDIVPGDGDDGGIAGGNIRVGLLYNPQRVFFVDRGSATADDAARAVAGTSGPQLTLSPGRVDPLHPAWKGGRKPLAAEIEFASSRVFVIVVHLSSKLAGSPLFGAIQPPVNGGVAERNAQARVIHHFVADILAIDGQAKIVVMGDFNEFAFSSPLEILEGGSPTLLNNLTRTLPVVERYTLVFEGNGEAFDHIFVSQSLVRAAEYDIVHVAAEFKDGVSDHDPIVARLTVNDTALTRASVVLGQNRPNPFNAVTAIPYRVAYDTHVSISIYDVAGRLVRTLADTWQAKNNYVVVWDGKDNNRARVPSGTYFCRAATNRLADAMKMTLLE